MPTVLDIHGGGWILGDAGTHHRLVRELAVGADAAPTRTPFECPDRGT
ncbi:alpha/beta hydrolase fold domain-containing protein [Nocardia sp. NPDC052278]